MKREFDHGLHLHFIYEDGWLTVFEDGRIVMSTYDTRIESEEDACNLYMALRDPETRDFLWRHREGIANVSGNPISRRRKE